MCRLCNVCAAIKSKCREKIRLHCSGNPFERIGVDITGPFHITDSGNRVMLVVMDYFTKWPEVSALPNEEASTVAKALVDNYGLVDMELL